MIFIGSGKFYQVRGRYCGRGIYLDLLLIVTIIFFPENICKKIEDSLHMSKRRTISKSS
jgi:hypothetical protein